MRWLLFIACALAAGAEEATLPESPVSTEARRILANTRDTRYQHRTEVDEEAGRYWLDCSGLASVVLRQVDTNALDVVENCDHEGHPRAFAYHDVFAAAPTNAAETTNGWVRVERLADLRPGDFVAWRKPVLKPGESTGHIVIVDDKPAAASNNCWRIPVIHSTGTVGTGGVARATIWLTMDEEGRPIGIRRRSDSERVTTNLPIAMARLVP